jgi:hypothetical protein
MRALIFASVPCRFTRTISAHRWNPEELLVGYRDYSRNYEIVSEGKPAIQGSADPAFRGDRSRHCRRATSSRSSASPLKLGSL